MSSIDDVSEVRSLGELLDELRPGAPCPWCGGDLHVPEASRTHVLVSDVRPDLESEVAALWCPDCGAEVHTGLRDSGPECRRLLGAAA